MKEKKRSDREKLLKLIDGDEHTFKDMQNRSNVLYYPRKIKEILYLYKSRMSGASGGAVLNNSGWTLRNKILLSVLLLGAAYCIIDFIVSPAVVDKSVPATLNPKYAMTENTASAKLNPLSYYIDRLVGNSTFNPQRISGVQDNGTESAVATVMSFKLVGVDWGGDPVAMIEDTQSGKTYFAKKDTSVREYKVVDILRDRVILGYENKTIEIK